MPVWFHYTLAVLVLLLWAWEAGAWWERRKQRKANKPSEFVPVNWGDDTLKIRREHLARLVRRAPDNEQ